MTLIPDFHDRLVDEQGQPLYDKGILLEQCGALPTTIGQATDLIMAWNDDPGRDFQHKWLISVPILLGLIRGSGFSASQGRVLAVMKHRQSDIEHHHQKHRLGSRHNRCHNQSITKDLLL